VSGGTVYVGRYKSFWPSFIAAPSTFVTPPIVKSAKQF
jgi:hypothetical protein